MASDSRGKNELQGDPVAAVREPGRSWTKALPQGVGPPGDDTNLGGVRRVGLQ